VLFVGTPAKRKGLDLLLWVWPKAFSPWQAPKLVIKTENWPARPDGYAELRNDVAALAVAGYPVVVITATLSDGAMAELYRDADLLVLPHRGEGFGLPLLEAMACGTPVLTTAWSGPLDFVDDEVGFLLDFFCERTAGDLIPPRFGAPPEAVMVEPDVDAPLTILQAALEDPELLERKGAAAAARAAEFTWDHIAAETAATFGY
jgi:glycosyltransferase involved in cell wall biosynthesis